MDKIQNTESELLHIEQKKQLGKRLGRTVSYWAYRYSCFYLAIAIMLWGVWILVKNIALALYYVTLVWCTDQTKITETFQKTWINKLDALTSDERDPFLMMDPVLAKWELKIEDEFL